MSDSLKQESEEKLKGIQNNILVLLDGLTFNDAKYILACVGDKLSEISVVKNSP